MVQVLNPVAGTSTIATSFYNHQTNAIGTHGRLVAPRGMPAR